MRLDLPRILSITAIALLVVIGNAGRSETGSPRSAVSSAHPDTTGAARRLAGVVERLRTQIEAESRGLDALTVSGMAIQAVLADASSERTVSPPFTCCPDPSVYPCPHPGDLAHSGFPFSFFLPPS